MNAEQYLMFYKDENISLSALVADAKKLLIDGYDQAVLSSDGGYLWPVYGSDGCSKRVLCLHEIARIKI